MTIEKLLHELDIMLNMSYMFTHQVARVGADITQLFSVFDLDKGEFLVSGAVTAEMLLDELRRVLNTKKGHDERISDK